jgi:hypothetical protein
VSAVAVDDENEIVGIAHQPPVTQLLVATTDPLILGGHLGVPLPVEVLIQRRQCDVGQQRGHDSSHTIGNFAFEVSLSYRRLEQPRRVTGGM